MSQGAPTNQTYSTITVEVTERVALVTITREKALNALNATVIAELTTALGALDADAAVGAVILTGAGEKAFVAGADIAAMADLSSPAARTFAEAGHGVGDLIARMGKPVIAAVNGFALGGGCELMLACDFAFASERAKFGQPEVNLGLMPGFGGTQRLLRRVGPARASELVLTADLIGADEALRIGLVNAVVPADKLLEHARAQALKIASKAPLAVAASKRALRRAEELSLGAGNELERELFAGLFSTADQKEGTRAFLEKRPAKFIGR
ncbi:MAG: enoyl-CoA hydratase-related protein [Polyangia bacterium]